MKGFSFLIGGLIALFFLGGLTVFSYFTGSSSSISKSPLDIFWSAAMNIPWDSLREYFIGGMAGIIIFLSDYILKPITQWVMSVLAGRDVVLPSLMGYILTSVLIALVIWALWGRIWEFAANNIMRVLMILMIVFGIGIALVFLGVI